jgi:4-alpha-glucanotransferase
MSQLTKLSREELDAEINWALIRMAIGSVADTAIVPFQDILGFGAETRMNTPGTQQDNWQWRFGVEEFENPARDRLRYLTRLYTRGRSKSKERINY